MDLNSLIYSPREAAISSENALFHNPGEFVESAGNTRRQPLEDAGNIPSLMSQRHHESMDSPENLTSPRRVVI